MLLISTLSCPEFSNKPKITPHTYKTFENCTVRDSSLLSWEKEAKPQRASSHNSSLNSKYQEVLAKDKTIKLHSRTVQETLQLFLEEFSSAPLAGRQKPQLYSNRKGSVEGETSIPHTCALAGWR